MAGWLTQRIEKIRSRMEQPNHPTEAYLIGKSHRI